ncbi:hypothetical protein ACP70R_049317 [Stipagrostis hirtigluma subsp. patula]
MSRSGHQTDGEHGRTEGNNAKILRRNPSGFDPRVLAPHAEAEQAEQHGSHGMELWHRVEVAVSGAGLGLPISVHGSQ